MKSLLGAALLSAVTIVSANADPVTALSCVSGTTKAFATVGIKTGLFAPSTQQILQYDVRLGKLGAAGEVVSEKTYELESNMKIFDNAAQAFDWVMENSVVIPLSAGKFTSVTIVVERAKKKIVVVDLEYETIEVLDCLVN